MDPSAVPALPARQPTPDLTAVLKHIEMSPDQLLSMVIAKHSTALLGAAFTLPQPGGLSNLQNDRRSLVVKPALDHFPVQSQSQQFLKHSFRCHAPTLRLFHRKQRRTLGKLGAMGDSLTDEYWDNGVSSYATNWPGLVVLYRGVNMGPTAASSEERRVGKE